jgi:hypothetical protein
MSEVKKKFGKTVETENDSYVKPELKGVTMFFTKMPEISTEHFVKVDLHFANEEGEIAKLNLASPFDENADEKQAQSAYDRFNNFMTALMLPENQDLYLEDVTNAESFEQMLEIAKKYFVTDLVGTLPVTLNIGYSKKGYLQMQFLRNTGAISTIHKERKLELVEGYGLSLVYSKPKPIADEEATGSADEEM